ncbi:MAG TPA: diacylglycerol kinase [Candidatus Onthousia faecavium]|nr:diacylglycerol kinase [Candidatus Onthousia faecavium]
MASQGKKKFGLKRVLASIINSYNGLKVAYKNEQSMYIHAFATIIILILSIILKISLLEWLAIIAIIGLTLAVELLNTAIENTVDLVTKDYNALAKIAKDTASAAEFVMAITGGIISLLIFIPKIIALF